MTGGAARADVAWQHSLTVRAPGEKPLSAVLQFAWSGDRQRTRVAWNPIPGLDMGGMNGKKLNGPGSAAIVTRLDDDRELLWSSVDNKALQIPRRAALEAASIDLWSEGAIRDPQLAKEETPQLTLAQRRRLGREIRASLRPLAAKAIKTYYRVLPGTRTFDGIEGRGYRLTMLVNTGGYGTDTSWSRVVFEWYLAGDLAGDEEIRAFARHSREITESVRKFPTTSMWLNEIIPVLAQVLPDSIQQAAATLTPPVGSPREGLGGTPLRLYATAYPSPAERGLFGKPGADSTVRLELALKTRSTEPLPASVFEVPSGFNTKVYTPAELKGEVEKAKKQGRKATGMPLFVPMMSGSDAYSWSAMRDLQRAVWQRMNFAGF